MSTTLDDIIDAFRSVDSDTRLELLLDYANKLPPLPQKYVAERDAGLGRVHECMTPVFLFVEKNDGKVTIHADVAEEAPTVKGFVAIIVSAFNGSTPQDVANAPSDLLQMLGLDGAIRMNRRVGLTAVLGRIRAAAA